MKFIFRGTTLFTYDPDTKMVRFAARKEYVEFNQCKFVPEDYALMSQFFMDVTLSVMGVKTTGQLKDIVVD